MEIKITNTSTEPMPWIAETDTGMFASNQGSAIKIRLPRYSETPQWCNILLEGKFKNFKL